MPLLQLFVKSLTRGPQYVVKKGSTKVGTQMEMGPKDNVSIIPASLRNFSVWVKFSGGLEDLQEKNHWPGHLFLVSPRKG